jgi:tRNA1Val (adenine37-N6)-methyltransferase
MSTPYFHFKRFTVWHDRCAMKVGTDGTLLGAWVHVSSCRNVLDVGTGTGLIALMIAQRNEYARIDGLEIDSSACAQAAENVAASPFAQQIRILPPAPFHDYARTAGKTYDLILSNPPYFIRSLQCPEAGRRMARHDDTLSAFSLVTECSPLLTPEGRMALILPFQQQDEFLRLAHDCGFHCIRHTNVVPVEGARPKRVLIELSPQPQPYAEAGTLVLEHTQHRRTQAYLDLMRDFYL